MKYDRIVAPLNDAEFPALLMPILLQLGITFECNMKCQHCYAKGRLSDGRHLGNSDVFKEALTELAAAGCREVVYSHGENVLRSDFVDISSHARTCDLRQTLMTNGLPFSDAKKAREVKSIGIERVLVSMDAVPKGEYDSRRGCKGAYRAAIRGVAQLKKAGIRTVGFSVAVNPEAIDVVNGIILLAATLGLDCVSVMTIRRQLSRAVIAAHWPDKYAMMSRVLSQMIQQAKRAYGLDVYTHDPMLLQYAHNCTSDKIGRATFIDMNACQAGRSILSIDPFGDVRACNFMDKIWGNIKAESVGSIWLRITRSRRMHSRVGLCCSSSISSDCHGGCRAFANGSKEHPWAQECDARCPYRSS